MLYCVSMGCHGNLKPFMKPLMSLTIFFFDQIKSKAAASFLWTFFQTAALQPSSLNQDRIVVNHVERTGSVLAPAD